MKITPKNIPAHWVRAKELVEEIVIPELAGMMPDPVAFNKLQSLNGDKHYGTMIRILVQFPGTRRFLHYKVNKLLTTDSGCSYTPRGVGSGEVELGINTNDHFMKNEFQMWFTIKQWLAANTCYYCQQTDTEWNKDAEEEDLIHIDPIDWHVNKTDAEFLRLTNWEYMDAELCGYWVAHNKIATVGDIETFFEGYPYYSFEATKAAARYTKRRYVNDEHITPTRTEKFNNLLEEEMALYKERGNQFIHNFAP